tara:strand:- start:583 stop:870 length:288 start_codon:yes stop_codon:yes gene_type:complete
MEEFNGFDAMAGMADPSEVKRMEAEQKIMWDKVDELVHQVFKQNKQGADLLAHWTTALMMAPTVTASSTQMQVGIAEGKKEFIRNILLTIKRVEE